VPGLVASHQLIAGQAENDLPDQPAPVTQRVCGFGFNRALPPLCVRPFPAGTRVPPQARRDARPP
jgi:hypothetical protein